MKRRVGVLTLLTLVIGTGALYKSGALHREADPPAQAAYGRTQAETAIRTFEQWRKEGFADMSSASSEFGKALLQDRLGAMEWLIRNDPEAAVAQTLSYAERARLPEEWQDLVEERFSEVVELEVLAACGHDGTELRVRRANGSVLTGRKWGALRAAQSKRRIPVEGIAIGGQVALFDNGVVRLTQADHFALTGRSDPAVLMGGCYLSVNETEAEQLSSLYLEVMSLPGPATANPLVRAITQPGAALDLEEIRASARLASADWTTTPKTVLLINTVYPDDNERVGTAEEWEAVMSDVSDWFRETSFGKTWLEVTLHPGVVTLPKNKEVYVSSQADPVVDAMAKAGVSPDDHDITIVVYPHNPSNGFGGMATIGGWRQEINGSIGRQLIAHETGHNYGLLHSTSWDANDGRIMPEDASAFDGEFPYGDLYCVMGSGSFPEGHFNPFARERLGWLDPDRITVVTEPGVYRIFATDDPDLPAGLPIALKVQRTLGERPLSETFWLGFRGHNQPDHPHLHKGPYVLWQHSETQTRLLDMTPDSRPDNAAASEYRFSEDLADCPLPYGTTFADPGRMLFLTPLEKGVSGNLEYMDIRVDHLEAGNSPPYAEVSFPEEIPHARTSSLRLSATFGDPDADPLNVEWDFGNGVVREGSTVDWVFLVGGPRVVTFRVRDGRGGIVEKTHTYNIEDSMADWTDYGPLPGFEDGLHDCVSFKGGYVGISGSNLLHSEDGETWQVTETFVGSSMTKLAASPDEVVAVGRAGELATTTDGLHWEVTTIDGEFAFQDVTYGHGQFLAAGTSLSFGAPEQPPMYRSFNGFSWEAIDVFPGRQLYSVLATKYGFVSVPGNTLTGSPAFLSTDGSTWTEAPPVEGEGSLPAYLVGNGSSVIGFSGTESEYLISMDDGRTWTRHPFGIQDFRPHMGAYGQGLWFAANDSPSGAIIAVSPDGLRWDVMPNSTPPERSIKNLRVIDERLWVLDHDSFGRRSGLILLQADSPGAFPFIPSALVYAGSWMHSNWFGWWQTDDRRTALHLEHGWIFFGSGNETHGLWFYDHALAAWAYTRAGIWPWLYIAGGFSGPDWLFYATGARPGQRWFYSATRQQWLQE